jgi:hypothetical protein
MLNLRRPSDDPLETLYQKILGATSPPLPLTPAYQGGELFYIGKGSAHGVKPAIKTGALDLRFCGPPEAALVVVAFEF